MEGDLGLTDPEEEGMKYMYLILVVMQIVVTFLEEAWR